MEDFNISLTNHSNSSIYCKYDEPDSGLENIAKITAFVLLIVLGIFGNIFVIVLAAKYTVRKNMHHLIINMAVSDSLFLLAYLLFNISWMSQFRLMIFRKGIIMHGSLLFLLRTAYRISLVTLLVISIERFRATRATLTRSRSYTFKQLLVLLGICWLISMPAAAYLAYCSQSRSEPCKRFRLADGISLLLLCFVILVLSTITMRRLSRPQSIQTHLNEQQRNLRNRRTQAAVRMVLASVLLYMCCRLPAYVTNALVRLDFFVNNILDQSACIDWKSFEFITLTVFPAFNSFFSPLIYIIFMPDFRQAAKKALFRRETPNQAPNRRNSVHVLPEMHAISQNH